MITQTSATRTLPSNTGLDSQPEFQVGIDWLDISFRKVPDLEALYSIISELEVLTGEAIDFSPTRACFNGRQWDGSGRGTTGTLLWYDSGDRTDGSENSWPQLKIAMSGRVLGGINEVELASWLIGRACENELDSTRIDIALDDRDCFVPIWKITEAKRAGNFFNALESSYHESSKRGQDIGRTIYFGAATSQKRLRIYDKTVESSGKIKGNRWEAEFRKKAAREALYQWLEEIDSGIERAVRWCKNVVVGVIDFRDRGGDDPNRSRCKPLEWFTEFCSKLSATPIRLRVTIPVQSMQKSINWVTDYVAPTLTSLRSVLGKDFPEFIERTMLEGGERLSNIRRKLIEKADKEQLCY